jgi:hypothetical protein
MAVTDKRQAVGLILGIARFVSTKGRRSRPRPSTGESKVPSVSRQGAERALVDPASGRDDWVEVKDPKTQGIYYWNRSTSKFIPALKVVIR